MELPERSARQGHRLIQLGVFLFLISLFVGIAIPKFPVPRLALSTHLLGLMQGLFLSFAGLVWPRLALSSGTSRAGVFFAVYGCLAAWLANLFPAVWRAGNTLLPIAAGAAHGTIRQELAIAILLRSGGICLILSTIVILWGLRDSARGSE